MSDIAITAANVIPSASAQYRGRVIAGVALTAGQVVYQDTDKSIKLADANAATPAFIVYGIAANAAGVGQPVDVISYDPALAIGGTVAANATVILSATPGGIAPDADCTTGWRKTILGVGIGSNKILFNPSALASGVAS